MIDKGKQLKKEVLTYYGNGICQCIQCSFSDIRALCLDHIDGKGKYLETKRSGNNLYRQLKKQGFPKGFQTLCFNCNVIKAQENSEIGIHQDFRAQKREAKLLKESKIYETQIKGDSVNEYASVLYFENYIKGLSFYRFCLKDIYERLQLNNTKKTLLRATCLKLCRENKLRRLGKGKYEKVIEGINC